MRHKTQIRCCALALMWAWVTPAIGAADKCSFTLLDPTPRERMREMLTDRPDKTESPYTVDAGHFQLEMDILSYSHDEEGSVRTRRVDLAPVNLKVGLLNNLDVQVVAETFSWERVEEDDARETRSGYGDTALRVKLNLWGNDAGSTAPALMPFIKFPTNQDELGNDNVEGGLIVPLGISLPGDWSLGLMTEFDYVRDDDDRGYHLDWVNSITASHDIVGNLAGYIEFFSAINMETGDGWAGTVDLGLTYALTDDIQLDGGINIGITDEAEDWNPFIGLSKRF